MKKYQKWSGFVLALFLIWNLSAGSAVLAGMPETVLVGGMPFGIKFFSQGIVVVGFTEVKTPEGTRIPAYDAGLRVNDVITHINGEPVRTTAELVEQVERTKDQALEITYVRDGSENTVSFFPTLDEADGRHKTGMWIRDTTAGIGTVTYILPDSGIFAGLGHGICDSESGELLPMERGTVVDVRISGVTRGTPGTPGELRGYFTSDKSGVLYGNTLCGVYGVFAKIPETCVTESCVPVGERAEVHEGEATILCTLDDNTVHSYRISIQEILRDSTDNRSFSITVTDPELLERTGGIVQGMSGSPILQEGRLIGAVTHVLVNDPTRGYGIFIDNMMREADSVVS